MRTLAHAWATLPEPLRARLGQASTGWRHLARTGALALELSRAAAQPEESARLAALAADVLLWACGENPLSGPLAAEVLAAPGLVLPQHARAALQAVAGRWRTPDAKQGGAAYFERLAARRDLPRLADFIDTQLARDPAALFWREKALALALYCGEAELARRLTRSTLDGLAGIPGLEAASAGLEAQAAFLRGDHARCLHELSALSGLPPVYGPAFAQARTGLCLLAAGDERAASPARHAALRAALRAAPWQINLARVLADALTGLRGRTAPPPGPALVMLYTWNKAADLDATLASLAASDLGTTSGPARIMALDNGSTDDTPAVLDAWAERLGRGLLRVTLPVNIGAPAARNWLAATPEARAAETLVYLDDDVDLPPDWLGRLGAALAQRPQAGVVGCTVADHHAPHLLQNVAGHLCFPPEASPDRSDRPDLDFQSLTPNPFRLSDAHLDGPDWGLFAFVGECDSVTGCCHLFTHDALFAPASAGGGFSLALGPSQYDDFERDLRMLSAGRTATHQGHLRVRHRKRSGLAAQSGSASSGALGNRYKMQTMHTREQIAGFINAQARRLDEAAARALALIDREGE